MFGDETTKKFKMIGFKCQQCGNCCLQLGSSLELSNEEVKRWEEAEDPVLSNFGCRWLDDFMEFIPETSRADLWFHPDTGGELLRCPFLRKRKSRYQCLIYDGIRPEICKSFPVNRSTGELIGKDF